MSSQSIFFFLNLELFEQTLRACEINVAEIKLSFYPLIIDANPISFLMCFMKLFDNNTRLHVLSTKEVLCSFESC